METRMKITNNKHQIPKPEQFVFIARFDILTLKLGIYLSFAI